MTLEEFEKLAKTYNIVPVFERITADLLTPVLAFLKIRNTGSNHFLLESVEGIGRLARYSFIGKNPSKVFYNHDKKLSVVENGQKTELDKDIFEFISEEISKFDQPIIDGLPDFSGGIVGYLGYENIGLIENVIKFTDNCQLDTPDSFFGIYNTLIIFDHYKHQLIILTNVLIDKNRSLKSLYKDAKERLKKIREEIDKPVEFHSDFKASDIKTINNKEEFYSYVNKCKQNMCFRLYFQNDLTQNIPVIC